MHKFCKKLKVLSWNIGKKIIDENQWQNELAETNSNVAEIINTLDPDICFFQEICSSNKLKYSQSEWLSSETGLDHYVDFALDKSHHVKQIDLDLGISILSKYPIIKTSKFEVFNPDISVYRENGEIWHSHNKGFLTIEIMFSKIALKVINVHLLPLPKFKIKPNDSLIMEVWQSIHLFLLHQNVKNIIIGGDFNIGNIEKYVKKFQKFKKINSIESTTIDGRNVDYFFCSNDFEIGTVVVHNTPYFLDHKPIILTLNLK
ncbi:MAG: endonuclease/exonuclease/phosphatase family protein [Bacteroidota bacterium]